jgi:hypothetical protein
MPAHSAPATAPPLRLNSVLLGGFIGATTGWLAAGVVCAAFAHAAHGRDGANLTPGQQQEIAFVTVLAVVALASPLTLVARRWSGSWLLGWWSVPGIAVSAYIMRGMGADLARVPPQYVILPSIIIWSAAGVGLATWDRRPRS